MARKSLKGVDRKRVINAFIATTKKNKWSVNHLCVEIKTASSGWFYKYRAGNGGICQETLEKLAELSGHKTDYFMIKNKTDEPEQMELDLKQEPEPEPIEDHKKLRADYIGPVEDPQFGALCVALYNVYCSDYTAEVTFKITKR